MIVDSQDLETASTIGNVTLSKKALRSSQWSSRSPLRQAQ
jgi:hypothetical protein